MKELINYLEEQTRLTINDLRLDDKERYELVGQHKMIDMIKSIEEKGYPDDNRSTK